MSLDLTAFDPQRDRPITEAAKVMMAEQVPKPAQFIQDCVLAKKLHQVRMGPGASNELEPFFDLWSTETQVRVDERYAGFKAWAQHKLSVDELRRLQNEVHFSRDLRKYAGVSNGDRTSNRRWLRLRSVQDTERLLQDNNLWI